MSATLGKKNQVIAQALRDHHINVSSDQVVAHMQNVAISDADLAHHFDWAFYSSPSDIRPSMPMGSGRCASGPISPFACPSAAIEVDVLRDLAMARKMFREDVLALPEDWMRGVDVQESRRSSLQLSIMGFTPKQMRWAPRKHFATLDRRQPNVTRCEGVDSEVTIYHTIGKVLARPYSHRIEENMEWFVQDVVSDFLGFHASESQLCYEEFVQLPAPFEAFGRHSRPDFGRRVRLERFPEPMSPLVFVATSNTPKPGSGTTSSQVELAMSLQPTLNMLALMYLSHRQSSEEKMPAWMFLYGIILHRTGFSIVAHYPRFVDHSKADGQPKWGYASVLVSADHKYAFADACGVRTGAVNALLAVQAHTNYVAEKLAGFCPPYPIFNPAPKRL
jgi:hypothetical protein